MSERRRRTTELVLGGGAIVLCALAGVWLFGTTDRSRGGAGPVEEARPEIASAGADLEDARVLPDRPEPERRAVAADSSEVEAPLSPIPSGTSSIAGVFFYPRSVPNDAVVKLHARGTQTSDHGETRWNQEFEFPIAKPWRIDEQAAGSWHLRAELEIEDRTWSSDTFELELLEGENRTGVSLALVECYVEGIVTNRDGFPIANAAVEVTWQSLVLDEERLQHIDFGDGLVINRTISQGLRQQLVYDTNELLSDVHFGELSEFDPGNAPSIERLSLPEPLSVFSSASIEVAEVEAPTFPVQELAMEAWVRNTVNGSIEISDGSWSLPGLTEFEEVLVDAESEAQYVTDAGGYYRIPLPGPGRFGLRVDGRDLDIIAEDGEVEVQRANPIATHDFEVVLAARLEGRVTSVSGILPDDVSCFLRLEGDTDVEQASGDGSFRFERLFPGTYDLYARGGGERGQDWSHHAKLEIAEGEDFRYDPILVASFVVEGRVDDPDREAGLSIVAQGADNPSLSRTARVRLDGTFTLRGLYSSAYDLQIADREFVEPMSFLVDASNPPTFQVVKLAPRRVEGDD